MNKRTTVGIYLACGFTKKEIASKMKKSFHTINEEARVLYQETGSRNLADITCCMIATITKLPVREMLWNQLSQTN